MKKLSSDESFILKEVCIDLIIDMQARIFEIETKEKEAAAQYSEQLKDVNYRLSIMREEIRRHYNDANIAKKDKLLDEAESLLRIIKKNI